MTQYAVNKKDLHELLRMLGILQQDEEILLVNNIELRDYKQDYVSILVDKLKHNVYSLPPGQLTEKELETLRRDLLAFEQFLLGEFRHVHKQLNNVRREQEKRASEQNISNDGVPMEVDEKISDVLKNLLSEE